MNWYVTVGVPGGEFAVKAESWMAAGVALQKANGEIVDTDGLTSCVTLRLAPPDLVEWLENSIGSDMWTPVCGGWLVDSKCRGEMLAPLFIPIPLAQGITVIDTE